MAEMAAPDGVFSGYASLFGVEDLARDVILPGAFGKSLKQRGAGGVKLLWQHDPAQPVGEWLDIREDARGLRVEGRILTELERGRELLALMRAGILDGLSIGFRTVRANAAGRTGTRRLAEVDLWEISLVTFPMLADARVSRVGENKSGTFGGREPAGTGLAERMRAAAGSLAKERIEQRCR
jgi:HK97 family phage prohead protease